MLRFGKLWWSTGLCNTMVCTSTWAKTQCQVFASWLWGWYTDISDMLVSTLINWGNTHTHTNWHTNQFISCFTKNERGSVLEYTEIAVDPQMWCQGLPTCDSCHLVQRVEHDECSIPSPRWSLTFLLILVGLIPFYPWSFETFLASNPRCIITWRSLAVGEARVVDAMQLPRPTALAWFKEITGALQRKWQASGMDLGSNRLIAHVFAKICLGHVKIEGWKFPFVPTLCPKWLLKFHRNPVLNPAAVWLGRFGSPRWAASKWAVLRVLRWPSIPKWMKPISHPWVSDLRSGNDRRLAVHSWHFFYRMLLYMCIYIYIYIYIDIW